MAQGDDIRIRKEGRAGRITLTRPGALNALTHQMCLQIDAALIAWGDDPEVALILLEGEGERAFCAGGDITEMYHAAGRGELDYGRRFWAEEYRMNARLFHWPKPVVAFLQGFTMGGGVGVGCHASHRIVDDSSRIAMPECGIGLVPDVGGSLWLARAPGRLGVFLGVTGYRMDAGDAIHAGFADLYVPEGWEALKAQLVETGDATLADQAGQPAPEATLSAWQAEVDRLFAGATLGDIARGLVGEAGPAAQAAQKALARDAPLAMACCTEILQRLGPDPTIEQALQQEFRYTARALEQGDFVEGIRAQIIDKDRTPRWSHDGPEAVTPLEVSTMLRPLGPDALKLEDIA